MKKFLDTVRVTDKKDELIKKSIISQLSNNIKELQYSGLEENCSSNVIDPKDAANQLCTIIEAMFLHGIKDSLTHRFRKALTDVDVRPEPSFWAPLLVISHRQIIDQMNTLSQITTETGQCRAWIRQALNDCILSSHISTIRKDSSSVKSYYRVSAFLRDNELLDVAQQLIESFESFNSFNLPCNSSLLNTWPQTSLYLAGLWAPTLKTCPIAPCDDIVQSIDGSIPHISDNTSDTNSLSSAISFTSQTLGFKQMLALNEDDVLKMILMKVDKKSENTKLDDKPINISQSQTVGAGPKVVIPSIPASCSQKTSELLSDNNNHEEGTSIISQKENEETNLIEDSFNEFINNYNILQGDNIRTPDLKNVWQKIENKHAEPEIPVIKDSTKQAVETVPKLAIVEDSLEALTVQLGKICNEKGLDKQDFQCLDCKTPFLPDQIFNVCAYTGNYYCDSCMSETEILIPAKIIHNWDFNSYPVCRKSYDYINEIIDQPILDFKILNPLIYSVVKEMSDLQTLRHQLNYLRAYLYTCRSPVIEELQKLIHPREYMYEHVHQYSVKDLSELTNGTLAQCLQKGVDFGKDHVNGCWFCTQKGFVCEICSNPKTIFPFDVEDVYRCNDCNAAYHKVCLTSHKSCRKCERKKEREDAALS